MPVPLIYHYLKLYSTNKHDEIEFSLFLVFHPIVLFINSIVQTLALRIKKLLFSIYKELYVTNFR